MSIRIRFWGTRGSIASPGASTVRYGGNTPCVEVRTPKDRLVILDAGTGIRSLGQSLMERASGGQIEADVFVTHVHWDHIQGIPFFAPLFVPGNHLRFWGWDQLEMKLERVIKGMMLPAVFPVPFNKLGARVDVCDVVVGRSYGDDCVISAMPVQHPGGALGYRVDEVGGKNAGLVYISDSELAWGDGYALGPGWRSGLVEWMRGAKVLVHDAMYTASEYEAHRGWGHSTCDQAVELAIEAGVDKLVLYHHHPDRTDGELDAMLAHCRKLVETRGAKLSVDVAMEGMELIV